MTSQIANLFQYYQKRFFEEKKTSSITVQEKSINLLKSFLLLEQNKIAKM